MSKITNILEKLRAKGHRLTKARKSIIDIFLNSRTPLTVPALKSLMEERNLNVNRTTVYREVDFLKGQKMIREIQFNDGLRRYEISPDNHHHHLICIQCQKVECVEMERCLKTAEEKLSEDNNFRIIKHSLEFYGICAECE